MTIVPIPSASASWHPNSAPAPPNGSRAMRRGSRPRATLTRFKARAIAAPATATIPAATRVESPPAAGPSRSRARSAAAVSSRTSSASGLPASSQPSARQASVTVGRSPPRP